MGEVLTPHFPHIQVRGHSQFLEIYICVFLCKSFKVTKHKWYDGR